MIVMDSPRIVGRARELKELRSLIVDGSCAPPNIFLVGDACSGKFTTVKHVLVEAGVSHAVSDPTEARSVKDLLQDIVHQLCDVASCEEPVVSNTADFADFLSRKIQDVRSAVIVFRKAHALHIVNPHLILDLLPIPRIVRR